MNSLKNLAKDFWDSSSSDDDCDKRDEKRKAIRNANDETEDGCQSAPDDSKTKKIDVKWVDTVGDVALDMLADAFTGGIYGMVNTGIDVVETVEDVAQKRKDASDRGTPMTTKEILTCVADSVSGGSFQAVVQAIENFQKKKREKGESEELTHADATTILHDSLTPEEIEEVAQALIGVALE